MTPVGRSARLREPALRGVHLLVLSAFAVAQPLFDILSRNAEFFAVRGSTPSDIVLFALAVTFVPAAVLLAVEVAAGALHERAGSLLHLVFVGGLTAVFAVQALERLGLDGTEPLISGAALAGTAAAVAAWRLALFRTFLTVLAPAPLVFLGLFLLASPVTKLVFPGDVDVSVANVRADTPVVMVVLDELPVTSLLDGKGEIDARRYPNFARLARDSTWFRNTTTLSSSTVLAVPALLTGNVPRRGRLPLVQHHPHNLFTLLGGRYRLNVRESQTRLCPTELCARKAPPAPERLSSLYSDARVVYLHLVSPPTLEERLPAIDEAWTNFGRDDADEFEGATTTRPKVDIRTFHVGRVGDFKRFVRSIAPERSGAPRLDFLHVLLPHGPWLYFPDGSASAVATPRAPGRVGELWTNEWLALQAYQRHLLQLGFTDHLLGELVRKLERARIYDRALVVVTSDHGVSFRGGDKRRAPTRTNLEDLAFVPLFVKRPEQERGEVVDRHVRTIDVLPTIADALGVRLPWRVDGQSAFTAGKEARRVRVGRFGGDYEALRRRRDEARDRLIRLFGTGTWDVFGIGPFRGLVGRPVASLPVAADASAEATIDEVGSRLLRSLRARSAFVPSPLVGSLAGDGVSAGSVLAVALNGRIAAVTKAYEGGGAIRFSALARDSAFRPGRNDVRVFLVGGAGQQPELREVRTSLSG